MAYVDPFAPSFGSNLVVTPAATSASSAVSPHDLCVRLVNSGLNICYVRLGETAATATTADLPVLPGGVRNHSQVVCLEKNCIYLSIWNHTKHSDG